MPPTDRPFFPGRFTTCDICGAEVDLRAARDGSGERHGETLNGAVLVGCVRELRRQVDELRRALRSRS